MDDEVPLNHTLLGNTLPQTISQPVVVQTPAVIYEQPVHAVPHIATKQNTTTTAKTVTATSNFASAQTFLSYVQTNSNNTEEPVAAEEGKKTTITPSEFEELQKQLREMMLQMQTMQNNLQVMPQPTNAAANAKDRFEIYYDASTSNEFQLH